MPEGDTIYRAASNLNDAMQGRRIDEATANRQYGRGAKALTLEHLINTKVVAVQPRGKHMLMHLSNRHVLHSHMGMTGSWHIYRQEDVWKKPRHRAALVLTLTHLLVVCFTPEILELLTPLGYRRHPRLHRLGPDLLGPDWDAATALDRLRVHNETPVGEAIMNQTIACGIGNVYKSEVLFLMRMNPFASVSKFSDELLDECFRTARQLMKRNLAGLPRRTRFDAGLSRLWVYGRDGKPCFECGEPIKVRRQGDLGRTTYYCSLCQHLQHLPNQLPQ